MYQLRRALEWASAEYASPFIVNLPERITTIALAVFCYLYNLRFVSLLFLLDYLDESVVILPAC